DVIAEDLRPRADVDLDERRDLLRAVEQFAEQYTGAVRVLREEADRFLGDGVELRLAARRGLQDARDDLAPVREHLLEHAAAQVFLAMEVVEKGRFADADRLCDVVERGAHETAGGKQPRGLTENLSGDVELPVGRRRGFAG